MIVMTDIEYLDLAEALLRRVEEQCDALNEDTDADIDNQRAGGLMTLTFANGSQLVINLQRPLHEIWMAARAGGFHYRWADGIWHDTKTGNDFFADLSTLASDCVGRPLAFTA